MTILGTIMALSIPPMPVPNHLCKGHCCLMPVPNDPEAAGWRNGYCLDCVSEMDRAEFRDDPANWTREERAQHAREIEADSDMRRGKE